MEFLAILEALGAVITPDNIKEVVQLVEKLIQLADSIHQSKNSTPTL